IRRHICCEANFLICFTEPFISRDHPPVFSSHFSEAEKLQSPICALVIALNNRHRFFLTFKER
ncbi:MAG: hypothetical protein U9R66_00355, partial [Thermodesulfobacteriota bacterium]|nr:hypothetical protein [Thermodesulfobacteriota bacterium]